MMLCPGRSMAIVLLKLMTLAKIRKFLMQHLETGCWVARRTRELNSLTDSARVLQQVEAEETTKSGIILSSAAQEKPQEAKVLAVGPGGIVDGKEVKMQVKVGQKVIYSKYAGTEVKLDGETYIVVRESDILAIVED